MSEAKTKNRKRPVAGAGQESDRPLPRNPNSNPRADDTARGTDAASPASSTGSPATPVRPRKHHLRIADYLRKKVAAAEPRHMLESEAELCARFNVSRGPVRQALLALESEGRIYRISGRGSFVAGQEKPAPASVGSALSPAGGAPGAKSGLLPLWVLPIREYTGGSFIMDGLLSGLDQKTSEYGAALTIGSLDTNQGIQQLARQGTVTGIFTCASELPAFRHDAFADVPKIWLMTRRHLRSPALADTPEARCDIISPDNDAIGALAAQYLLDKGHKHLAFLNLLVEDLSASSRLPGFLSTAHAAGATIAVIDDSQIAQPRPASVPPDHQTARLLIQRLLKMRPRPTALFVPSDQVTSLIYPILLESGIRPEKEITIISCNNDERYLGSLHPRPASIDINLVEIGRRAADLMALRMNKEFKLPNVTIFVPPRLVLPGLPRSG